MIAQIHFSVFLHQANPYSTKKISYYNKNQSRKISFSLCNLNIICKIVNTLSLPTLEIIFFLQSNRGIVFLFSIFGIPITCLMSTLNFSSYMNVYPFLRWVTSEWKINAGFQCKICGFHNLTKLCARHFYTKRNDIARY